MKKGSVYLALLSVFALSGCGTGDQENVSQHRATPQRLLAQVQIGSNVDEEGLEAKAYRLYQAAFDRKPDLEGLGFWIYHMQNGMKLENVAWGFTNSNEFKTLYGADLSTEQFITQLYKNVLHRQPDPSGFSVWETVLNNSTWSREQVLLGFSESIENRNNVRDSIQTGIRYVPYGWQNFSAVSAPLVLENSDYNNEPIYAIADFDGDSSLDLALYLSSETTFHPTATNTAVPAPIRIFKQAGNALVEATSQLFPASFSAVLALKLLPVNLNDDGNADLVVAVAGPDPYPQNGVPVQAPPPGDYARWAASSSTGFQTFQAKDVERQFIHGGCSGDVNVDGKDDAFIVSLNNKSYFLLSDGAGSMMANYSRVPSEILEVHRQTKTLSYYLDGQVKETTRPQFSDCALVDVNGDTKVDLLMLGFGLPYHALYLNDGTGDYSKSQRVEIPTAGVGFGPGTITNNHIEGGPPASQWFMHGPISLGNVVMDVNGDGRKDVIVLMSENNALANSHYKGSRIQVLINNGVTFIDESKSRSTYDFIGNAMHSIGSYDVNGDGFKDLIVGRAHRAGYSVDGHPDTRILINNGAGVFNDLTSVLNLPSGSYVPMTVNGKTSLIKLRTLYQGTDPATNRTRSKLEVTVLSNGVTGK